MFVCVLGDATLDVSVMPTAPIVPGADQHAPIALGPGGQGANVAVRLARRGVGARLVAPIADDAAGRLLRTALLDEGVELVALPADRTAAVVVVVSPDGERAMLSDRVPFSGDWSEAMAGAAWVHCSGYLLRDRIEADRMVSSLRGRSGRLSVAGGSFAPGADAQVARATIVALQPDLLVLGRDETAAILDEPELTASDSASRLGGLASVAVVTDAARGSIACGGPLEAPLATSSPGDHDVVDTTGAGDAFTAALLAELVVAWPPDRAGLVTALTRASAAGADAASVRGAQARIRGERPARAAAAARNGE